MSERGTDKPKMRMNPQERMFYEQLPESMRAHSPGLTLSYRQRLGMLHGYLRVLYGERADWGRCVAGYEGQVSACGASGAREVACCKDVPEIGEADLEKWLSAEADDVALASEIADAFKKLQACEETLRCSGGPSNSPSKEEKRRQYARLQLRCAELLGVTPQLSGRVYYEHLIERRGMTSAEADAFFRRLYANDDEGDWAVAGGNFGMLVQELAKRFTDGLVANFGGTTAVMQAPGRYYYRGENAFYGSSRPGLFRGRKARMAPLDVFVSLLRMDEAGWFLDNFDAVREWPIANGTVRYEALMQHYGLPTWVLDATNDLITALFFACCKFEDDARRPKGLRTCRRARACVHGFGCGATDVAALKSLAHAAHDDHLVAGLDALHVGARHPDAFPEQAGLLLAGVGEPVGEARLVHEQRRHARRGIGAPVRPRAREVRVRPVDIMARTVTARRQVGDARLGERVLPSVARRVGQERRQRLVELLLVAVDDERVGLVAVVA